MWDLIVSVPDHCLSFYFDQCSVQFGFTKGLSPVMSALMISEARAEATFVNSHSIHDHFTHLSNPSQLDRRYFSHAYFRTFSCK